MKMPLSIFLFGTIACIPCISQQPRVSAAKALPTVSTAELQSELADDEVKIAILTAQLNDAKAELHLYLTATGRETELNNDKQAIIAAQKKAEIAKQALEPSK